MPFYKGHIFKRLTTIDAPPWSNVYTINAASEEDALVVCSVIVNIEKQIHRGYVDFFKNYVRQDSALAGSGRVSLASGIVGEREGDPTIMLPLWNVVRVTFQDSISRADQKFLRLPLEEDDVVGTFLEGALTTLIATDYVNSMLEIPQLVSADHVSYTSGDVQDAIQMRQRSWSRRARPGFKRGYVPV